MDFLSPLIKWVDLQGMVTLEIQVNAIEASYIRLCTWTFRGLTFIQILFSYLLIVLTSAIFFFTVWFHLLLIIYKGGSVWYRAVKVCNNKGTCSEGEEFLLLPFILLIIVIFIAHIGQTSNYLFFFLENTLLFVGLCNEIYINNVVHLMGTH